MALQCSGRWVAHADEDRVVEIRLDLERVVQTGDTVLPMVTRYAIRPISSRSFSRRMSIASSGFSVRRHRSPRSSQYADADLSAVKRRQSAIACCMDR